MDASTTVEIQRDALDEVLRNDGGAAYKFARDARSPAARIWNRASSS